MSPRALTLIKNFKKLTYYLDDHSIKTNNDFSERMLRLEKLIKANALFRATLDIIRSILQTAVAAKVDCQEYILWLMRQSERDIEANPDQYTTLAYARLR